jgi:hypothetical protein
MAIFLFAVCASSISAQDFVVDMPKLKKDDFAKSFVKLLNDAPNKFSSCKDKPVKGIDIDHPKSKVFHNKLKIVGSIWNKLVYDSSISFAEYCFGDFDKMDDAEAAYVSLSNLVSESLSKKVLFRNNDTGSKTGMLRQTKVAYTLNSGFFQYNVFIQLYDMPLQGKLRLMLKVNGGRPQYYYKMTKNEPISSFMFVSAVRSQLGLFQQYNVQGCLGDMPPYNCRGVRRNGDTTILVYVKEGFRGLLETKAEFEGSLSNLRACLTDEYVYYLLPPLGNHLREVAFVRFDDIENKHKKTIHLALVKRAEDDYILELGFYY